MVFLNIYKRLPLFPAFLFSGHLCSFVFVMLTALFQIISACAAGKVIMTSCVSDHKSSTPTCLNHCLLPPVNLVTCFGITPMHLNATCLFRQSLCFRFCRKQLKWGTQVDDIVFSLKTVPVGRKKDIASVCKLVLGAFHDNRKNCPRVTPVELLRPPRAGQLELSY